MKQVICFALCTFFCVITAVLSHSKINITEFSSLPLAFGVITLFQAFQFAFCQSKKDFNINNYSDLTEKEWSVLSTYTSCSFAATVPAELSLVFIRSNTVKSIASLFIYLAGFGAGAAIYRLLYGKHIKSRLEKEREELRNQLKNEEEGKTK